METVPPPNCSAPKALALPRLVLPQEPPEVVVVVLLQLSGTVQSVRVVEPWTGSENGAGGVQLVGSPGSRMVTLVSATVPVLVTMTLEVTRCELPSLGSVTLLSLGLPSVSSGELTSLVQAMAGGTKGAPGPLVLGTG